MSEIIARINPLELLGVTVAFGVVVLMVFGVAETVPTLAVRFCMI
jgi:hypothetical protein